MAKFLYFGFGSNLLRERIHLMNPSAVFKTIARLDGYKLAFRGGGPGAGWKGAPATILEEPGSHVWGCVWEVGMEDMPNLDTQEGVPKIYVPIEVEVTSPDNQKFVCRSYQKVLTEPIPEKSPSPQYLDVIIRGAIQNQLPQEYVENLKNFEHNKNRESVELYESVLKMIGKKDHLVNIRPF